ncbi:DNA polymerase delta subunit 3 isoform X1 [Strongylocentrotus purpuratus]|uniref:DNA polymerase delta subunit 3 n=1 Tax=Strongylocentrotus purpuratus TaxID=7668 RepID=A0A7M7NKX3_STRPU|nr:DNA polymerase delta subunit 3 isoform X1 [Strongylocentrotus purpuratus]
MDNETSMYLENIEEYVLDEDRVVTYKWLSQTLEIHVNLAKRLLETFLSEQKKKGSSTLNVTYAITGTQETKNGTQMTKIAIVKEDGLDAVKSGMKEVLGQHVFSIQKSALKDNSSLFTTDYEITQQNIAQINRFSAIQCKAVDVRSLADLERNQVPQQKSSTGKPKQVNGFGNQSTSSKPASSTLSSSSSSASQKSKVKKGSIEASFASQSTKNKAHGPKSEKTEQKPKAKKKEEQKSKPKGMLAFMSQKKKEDLPSASSGPAGDSGKDDKRSVKEEKEKEEEEEEEVDVESSKHEKTGVKGGRLQRSSQADKKKKRIVASDSESDDESQKKTVARKRRRILRQEDSSSEEEEDEEQDDMDDSPIPPTPPPVAQPVQSDEEDEATPPSKSQSEERSSTGKKRISKRVLRSKVTVDEEGCMVTEKVWETESTDASDDDIPPPAPKPKPQPKKEDKDSDDDDDKKGKKGKGKKTSPPSSSGKQSSLMSFFKKK